MNGIKDNPQRPCPPELLAHIVGVPVRYLGFDGAEHKGIIEVHESVNDDVAAFFQRALTLQFPIEKVARASDKPYDWDDDKLMADNASSGFNYRLIPGSTQRSLHGLGLAFDINTRLNPYIRFEHDRQITWPEGAVWDETKPGTLYASHPLVQFMKERGWEWGGDWTRENGGTDYQHFQKPVGKLVTQYR